MTVAYVCTDPEGNGHALDHDYPSRADALAKQAAQAMTPEQIEAQAVADDEARIAWAAAGQARREWLGTLVRAKQPNLDLARAALGAAVTTEQGWVYALAMLTGEPESGDPEQAEASYRTLAAAVPLAARHRHTIAYHSADHEDDAARFDPAECSPWSQHRTRQCAAWLSFLTTLGHPLTEIEQQVIDRAGSSDEHAAEGNDDQDIEVHSNVSNGDADGPDGDGRARPVATT